MFTSLPDLIEGPVPVRAPLVLNPLMAKLAERAGFPAVYLGGGGLGYQKVFLEANLTLTEVAHASAEIAAATSVPVIADIAGGWGEPMHLRRTVALLESSGVAAVELEDQLVPKRAHHHAGRDHPIEIEQMQWKIRTAVEARRDPRFLVIGRTDQARKGETDDALRRCEAYRQAGADLLMPCPGFTDGDAIVAIAERLGPPLMFLTPPGGLATVEPTIDELYAVGFRLLTDAVSLHLLMFETLRAGYAELAGEGFAVQPGRAPAEWYGLLEDLHEAIDLDALLEIERSTVERDES